MIFIKGIVVSFLVFTVASAGASDSEEIHLGCGDFEGETASTEFVDAFLEYLETEDLAESCMQESELLTDKNTDDDLALENLLHQARHRPGHGRPPHYHRPPHHRPPHHYRPPHYRPPYYHRPPYYRPPHHHAPLGRVCRAGYYFCVLNYPARIGLPCYCPGYNGRVTYR